MTSTSDRAVSGPVGKGSAEGVDVDDRDGFYRGQMPYVLAVLTRGFRVQHRDGKVGFHRVTNPAEVEDLTQEAFAAFFRQVENGRFDRSRPAVPYLRRIAINLALQRAGKQAKEAPLEAASEPVSPPPSLEQDELRGLMTTFKEQLSESEQAVLECLRGGEYRSQAAMGQALGLSRDQVYRLLVSIRKRASVFFEEKGWLP